MIFEIDRHLSILVQSVSLDLSSGSWTVAYKRKAWGMEKDEHYTFDRITFPMGNVTPYEVINVLQSRLRAKLEKGETK